MSSEKYAACRGSVEDGMHMITACFARAPQRSTSRTYMYFLLIFQEVRPIRKTRNQLSQRPRPQCHRGLLGLLPKLHRSDQSGMASGALSGRPFPYGQEYLGAPQKIAALLPQENQGTG